MSRITKEQAAIIGLYTGCALGPFEDIQKLAEALLGRPVFTHEFADKEFNLKLRELIRPTLLEVCYIGEPNEDCGC